uniref:Uncharacterized protein n=1 Tax=Anguilla anguilla TaxID=7936 RepID=A0A0E9S043_ANGAN
MSLALSAVSTENIYEVIQESYDYMQERSEP